MTTTTPVSDATDGMSLHLPAVSVVIPAWTEDRWNEMVQSVESVLRQSLPPLEVILVIDHNPALAARSRLALTNVTVVDNVNSRGASGARNTGAMISRGEIIAFTDDDTLASPDWLMSLCRHFDDQSVLGVGGRLILGWPGDRPRWFPPEFEWALGGSYTGMPETAAPVRNSWGGNMAIRRTAFLAVDGFRSDFGKTGQLCEPEDTDLCIRVRQTYPSGQWMYEPSAEVMHRVPRERTNAVFFLQRCWNEGAGKAALARLMGLRASTATERHHATRVLPRAFVRELTSSIIHGDAAAFQRSLAISAGLVLAAAGMLFQMLRQSCHDSPQPGASEGVPIELFRPILLREWDVLDPVSPVALDRSGGDNPTPVHVLVRMATEPLGFVDVDCTDEHSYALALLSAAESLIPAINRRLQDSGLPSITKIPRDGISVDGAKLRFLEERLRVLQDAPDISVIVCTRDRPAQLKRCIDRLVRQQYPNYEIVVVDNAPTDPFAVQAALDSLRSEVTVRYVLEARGGLSWARNAGWRAARADVLAFIDDDELADPHWLAELARGFTAAKRVGCVTGVILPAELRTQPQEWFEQFGGHSKGRGFTREVFGPNHPQSPVYPLPPFGAGGNMAFRRDVLNEMGGFNVALGGGTPTKGAEDSFAFTKCLLERHHLVYQPTAVVRHTHYDTLEGLSRQMRGYGTGLTAYYLALVMSRPSLLLELLRLLPAAINDLRGRDSIRTATMRDFPASVLRAHRVGMIRGMPAYLKSVIEQRRKDRAHRDGD